jgi:hypothetical protein
MMTILELMNRVQELSATDRRFLGYAALKTEGGVCVFDDAPPTIYNSMVWTIADIYRKQRKRKKINQKDVDRADAVVMRIYADYRDKAEAWCERKTASKVA